jgi:hypothetical protein
VAWWNDQRLHSACGDIPPVEFEAAYRQRLQTTNCATGCVKPVGYEAAGCRMTY